MADIKLPKGAKVLTVALDWMESHCVIPDQDHRGEAFRLSDDQFRFTARHYTVRPGATPNRKGTNFVFRRSQYVRAQKFGKSPLVAGVICLEGVGPALFDGWASGGELYDCRDFGCGCGWQFEYEPGDPMGRPWETPLIQVTATSEDQTGNTYDALRPMIELGPLADLIPKTGEEFIRLPGGGKIATVTSAAISRVGQRVTFVAQDETALWTKSNKGHELANAQQRGLAGMGGRSIETTNAWNPTEDSVAQRTYESGADDVQRDFTMPPKHLDFTKKEERRKILVANYKEAPWVDVDGIEALASEMMRHDAATAERFFGNRLVVGDGRWIGEPEWTGKHDDREVADGTRVVLGFDGSDADDHTVLVLSTLDGHLFIPTYGPSNRPTIWRPEDWEGRIPRDEVRAAVAEIAERYSIVRAYLDPFLWQSEIDEFAAAYGDRVFLRWATNSIPKMWGELRRFKTDVSEPDSLLTHDGNDALSRYITNAVMRARGLDMATGERRYVLGKQEEHLKIDGAMSAVLAHAACMDAIASGAAEEEDDQYVWF
ncbi:hypothetical protein [Microbacterium sp. GXF6406]